MAFPTLSVNPNFPIDEIEEDIAIKSKFESGHELARARTTDARKIFTLSYTMLSNADKALLEAHWLSVRNISTFSWTHPISNTVYTVRYKSPFTFSYAQYQRYNTNFILVEM